MIPWRELSTRGGDRTGYAVVKRVLDVIVASSGLLVLAPMLTAVWLLVKLDSPGPGLYWAARAGRNGRPFKMLKFRTMVVGADSGPVTTSRSDSRITRLGRHLRRHKLDELPQLVNVVLGDMSLVGPRPEVLKYVEQYTEREMSILSVRPGMTDLASVAYIRLSELIDDDDPDGSFERDVLRRKNALRMKYVTDRSLRLDVEILVQTVRAIFRLGGGHEGGR